MTGGTTPLSTAAAWYHGLSGSDTQAGGFSLINAGHFGAPMPVACTINLIQLNLTCGSSCGSADTLTVTIVKNGVDQAMSCSGTSGAANVTVKTSCTTSPVSLAAGDDVALKFTHTNGTPIVHVGTGVRCQ